MAKQNQSASPSSTARDERAMRRAIARVPPPTITPPTVTPPTVPLPTVPRELSMLSTDTAESIASLEQDARAKIQDYGSQSRQYDKLVKSGLLAFLTWLPEAGKTSLARDVIGASSEQQLYDVFVNLLTGIASPMKSRSKAPSVVESPYSKSQAHVEIVASTIDQPEKRDSSFATQLQLRDSYRCVITGQQNTDQWIHEGEPGGVFHGPTEGAHIIPFAFASWQGVPGAPRDVSSAWAVLYKCFPALRQILSVEKINSLCNGLTLRDSVHSQFGKFTIALKPTDIENEYEVKTYKRYPPADIATLHPHVRFMPNTEYEIPSRAILDTHWRMCEIFNASAMGETVEQHIRDWEELRGSGCAVVKEDGSTDLASLLEIALWGQVSA
ncbi:uncharacterized protein MYU51_015313 [Penicillium brevicompactum]|uniref:uncharacterized protein n=1 Tax=Penicillium brevicompactum TaxID=5074 RepID=UPI0025417BBE|nr:uncharacterized protein N7506_006506 [Penicillium brevicompactum]KAJ5332723.1 hypothetical protein N7506_006506 [Penicillium brevicompactum]